MEPPAAAPAGGALPEPQVGQVIRFNFLWSDEDWAGKGFGKKDRPCAIVVARKLREGTGQYDLVVAPITHSVPEDQNTAIKLTGPTQRRLGLDTEQCWIIASELNQFQWPSHLLKEDLESEGFVYGLLPAVVSEALKQKILDLQDAEAERKFAAANAKKKQIKPRLHLVRRNK